MCKLHGCIRCYVMTRNDQDCLCYCYSPLPFPWLLSSPSSPWNSTSFHLFHKCGNQTRQNYEWKLRFNACECAWIKKTRVLGDTVLLHVCPSKPRSAAIYMYVHSGAQFMFYVRVSPHKESHMLLNGSGSLFSCGLVGSKWNRASRHAACSASTLDLKLCSGLKYRSLSLFFASGKRTVKQNLPGGAIFGPPFFLHDTNKYDSHKCIMLTIWAIKTCINHAGNNWTTTG